MEFRYLCRPMYQPRHQKMRYLTLLFSLFFISSCTEEVIPSLEEEQYNWQDHYTKEETYIEMRDGVKLFTVIYAPKDTSQVYPVILKERHIVVNRMVLTHCLAEFLMIKI
jgi:predicted acyl esterase